MPRSLTETEIAEFRKKICDTATRLFAENGVTGVTMRELAKALKVSAMTPYRYFQDKNELLAELRAQAFNRFAAEAECTSTQGDLVHQFLLKRDVYIRFALSDPNSYRLMFDFTQPDMSNYPPLRTALARANATMASHIEKMVEAGLLQGDPGLISRTLWSLLHGIVSLGLAGKWSAEMPTEMLVDAGCNALMRGYGLDLSGHFQTY